MKFVLKLVFSFILLNFCHFQAWEKFFLYDDFDTALYGYYTALNELSSKNCPGFEEAYILWVTKFSS